MKEKKLFIETPDKPFIYVAGRPYLPLEPVKPCFPYVMTEERGRELEARVGKVLEVRFDWSMPETCAEITEDKYKPFISTEATLTDCVRVSYDGSGGGIMCEVFDAVWQLRIDLDPDLLDKIAAYTDEHISSQRALEKASAHWGSTMWSGLTVELIDDGKSLFRTDVDIFCPERPSLYLAGPKPLSMIMGFYSHKPIWGKVRKLKDIREDMTLEDIELSPTD